jgi:tryptophanyl-tRNA synthetase
MAQGLKRKVEAVEEHEMGGLGDAKASTEVAAEAVRIRTNHPVKVWAVKVIKTRIVDGNHMETQEEKGNPRICVVIAIIKVVIMRGRTRLLTHQEVAVAR